MGQHQPAAETRGRSQATISHRRHPPRRVPHRPAPAVKALSPDAVAAPTTCLVVRLADHLWHAGLDRADGPDPPL